MTLEVRIPISPRPAWLNRTKMIAASIRQFYPDAIISVYVGDPAGPSDRNVAALSILDSAWIDSVTWVPQLDFDAWAGTRSKYLATMNARFMEPFRGDHILMLDADVIPVARFDEMFEIDAMQGVQAHISPLTDDDWDRLFSIGCGSAPKRLHLYSGAGIMEQPGRKGPWYVNSGVMFGPVDKFDEVRRTYLRAIMFLPGMMTDTYWFDQLAMALAVGATGVPATTHGLRYNFPNRPAFDAMFPAELADCRFVHAMQTDIVDRDRDFETPEAMRRLVARRDLTGSNEVLRRRVAELLVPEPLRCAEDAPYA